MHPADIERDLEVRAIDHGIEAYQKNIEGRDPADLTPERRYIARGMDTLVPAIETLQKEWLGGAALAGSTLWGQFLCGLDARKLALMTLSSLYNYAAQDVSYTSVAHLTGNAVRQLRMFEQIKAGDNRYFHKAMAHIPRMTPNRLRLLKRNYSQPMKTMTHKQALGTGAKLIELAIEHTDMFHYLAFRQGGKQQRRIALRDEIRAAIEAHHEDSSLLAPAVHPMVIPPVDRTSEHDGGYLLIPTVAIKQPDGPSRNRLVAERADKIQPLLDTINQLQRTKWEIDRENLDLLKHIFYTGGDRAGVPCMEKKRIAPKPADYDTNKESKMAWLRDAARAHQHNAKLAGQRRLVKSQIDMASYMLTLTDDNPDITGLYYVWEACFRHRVYPKATAVSPQSSDTGRGLLKFKEGVPLGEHGYYWLSVGLAGAIGHDDVNFADRVRYVESRAREIEQWVSDPTIFTGWMDMDEPFQGMIMAREWVACRAAPDRTTFVSHACIPMDGTCNGLQHYSALGRDIAGATYTNLLPSHDPQSFYDVVTAAVVDLIEEDCRESERYALDREGQPYLNPCFAWRGRVVKKTVKVPAMTNYYGVTAFGMIDQLHAHVEKAGALEGHAGHNMRYMKDKINEALEEVVGSAGEIMSWMRRMAALCAKADKPVTWTSPMGIPVTQEYPNFAESSIQTVFHRMYWRDPFKRDKKRPMSVFKNANGMPPNYIHNIDACHMMLVVRKATALGITQFRMIHDSFAVHAGHMQAFKPLINEAFVEIHRQPLLGNLHADICKVVGEDVEKPPQPGHLNIEDVLRSPHLFC